MSQLGMIRVEQSFALYAYCSVHYDGRAKSTLIPGNYLIVHKNDGTLRIDGGSLCTPLNYQPPGAIMQKKNDKLISTRKDETITIKIEKIYYHQELKDWSSNKIDITKTEDELRNYIATHIDKILSIKSVEVYKEFRTPVGSIDILIIDEHDIYHVIEVKRGKASLSACSQLERYYNYFVSIMKNAKGYIASPEISKNALKYTENNSQIYLQVNHSI